MGTSAVARKKQQADKPTDRSQDRHKGGRLVRVREVLRQILEAMAADNASSFTEETNRLLVAALQAEGKWPPRPNAP